MIGHRPGAVLITLVGLGVLLIPAFARAHGIGTPQVINVANGPYLVSVWTDPDPLREDETHLVVAVMDPETRAPLVTNVTVAIRLDQINGNETVTATANSDNSANQLLYVVEFNDLVTAGDWQATIMIDGPWGAADGVGFPITITAARGFNWMWLGLGGLGLVVIAWLVLAGRPASGKRPSPPAPR